MQNFQELPKIQMKSANGTVFVYDNRVVIKRNDVTSLSFQGIKGDITFFYNNLSGVEYKKPSMFLNGYLRFIVPGTQARNPNCGQITDLNGKALSLKGMLESINNSYKDNMKDQTTIVWRACDRKQAEQTEQIYMYISEKINREKNYAIPAASNCSVNVYNNQVNDTDEMTNELIRIFKSLDFKDKMEIMCLALEKSNK